MAESPRFSVTVPAYNASATLAETVESVLAQTFSDWELVIVDDGSTDDTLAIAKRFAEEDPRVRVVSQANCGSGGAYNTAVHAAAADLLVMLSADDLLAPEHLERYDSVVAANPGAAVFTSAGFYEYEDGTREPVGRIGTWASPDRCTLAELFSACFFGVGAVYRRTVYDKVGGFREDLYAEDYLFWLLALAHGFEHRYLDEPLAVHRRNATQKSADAVRMREADIVVIQQVIGSGLLDPEQLTAAQRALARHRRNLSVRKALIAALGPERAATVIERMRGRGDS